MLNQDVFEDIAGMLQARVGTLLQAKTQLQEMSKSPVLTISDQANKLLVNQNQLETDLPGTIESAKSGGVSEMISAAGFFAMMEKQIYDVSSLWDEYVGLGASAKPTIFSGIPDWVVYASGGGLVLWLLIKKKHKYYRR
jgi:hypothetical protein